MKANLIIGLVLFVAFITEWFWGCHPFWLPFLLGLSIINIGLYFITKSFNFTPTKRR